MCQCVWLDGFVEALLCAAVRSTNLENGRCSAALVVARERTSWCGTFCCWTVV
jgi:hypothetical protein